MAELLDTCDCALNDSPTFPSPQRKLFEVRTAQSIRLAFEFL